MTCDKCGGSGSHSTHSRCARCLGSGQAMVGVSYAGIGSRETPETHLMDMENIAMRLALKGWLLRSGGAKGADTAFARGCKVVAGHMITRIATMEPLALAHASLFHPAWDKCDEHARALHARNSLVMMGDWLDDPVKFVVCWTPNAEVTGGTGQALRIAAALTIPVFNIADPHRCKALLDWLASDGK